MSTYDHKKIESSWVELWRQEVVTGESNWLFDEKIITEKSEVGKKKLYLLDMFPYPSGSGLHVGHVEEKVALDIYARYQRMKGTNVLFPTGYDSFGLPTENYAIKNNLSPQLATKQNTEKFHEQTEKLGISYDWTRELAASDPEYYKFTQWWFLFLYERGLAYRKKQMVNWCPKDQTVLANEQVIDGKCERCDTDVVQKEMEQWFFKITDYAERLLNDLDKLDWPESTKMGQRNWIGKSEGIEIDYQVPLFEKVLVATGNAEKIERVKRFVEYYHLPIEVLSPKDMGLETLDVEESGNLIENAEAKALAYSKLTDIPVVGLDGGVFCDKLDIDPYKVRRNALEGKDEKKLSQKEIAGLMLSYYRGKVEQAGDNLPAQFRDGISLAHKGKILGSVETARDIVLTSKVSKIVNDLMPLTSLYKPKGMDKFGSELDPEEKMHFIRPISEGLAKLFTKKITVFTTTPVNWGATFLVLAPEHKDVLEITTPEKLSEVKKYIQAAGKKTERERLQEGKDKTGVFTGAYAINHVTGEPIPVWVSDFVLSTVGTGAIQGCPGHDERDFEFAKKFDLPIPRVVVGEDGDTSEIDSLDKVVSKGMKGKMINSDFLNGLEFAEAMKKTMDYFEEKGWGRRVVNYKLRDWSISRQRYWGAPIPMLYKKLNQEEKRLNDLYQQKPEKTIIVHAWGSDPSKHFQPWLADQLVAAGVEGIVPDMGPSLTPKKEDWGAIIDKLIAQESENTVMVGRSLGAWAVLQAAEKKKFRKLVLICPSSPAARDDKSTDKIVAQEHKDAPAALRKFIGEGEGNVDWKKINNNVSELVIFLSTDDPYIPLQETKDYYKKHFPRVRIITVRDSGHFTDDRGYKEFPQLLEEILKPVRLDLMSVDNFDLPVLLPEDVDYRPQGTAPLGTSKNFNKSVDQKKYGKEVFREIDTMDTFVCSSWYFFRFIDPRNKDIFANLEKVNKIGPVDFYMGGAEHTVLHLLYARFFTKVAYDAGLIEFDEPFMKLRHQGTILGPDNRKMSKRWGNVIDPNDIVEQYGADTIRMYEMFMGPLDQMKPWSDGGVRGIRRFLQRVWDLDQELKKNNFGISDKSKGALISNKLNEMITGVEEKILNLKFNTAVSDFMKFINFVTEHDFQIDREAWAKFLLILSPFAPFMTSELWNNLHGSAVKNAAEKQVYYQKWPDLIDLGNNKIEEKVQVVIMVNGKLRDRLVVHKGTSKEALLDMIQKSDNMKRYLTDFNKIKKEIFVQDKLLNLVV